MKIWEPVIAGSLFCYLKTNLRSVRLPERNGGHCVSRRHIWRVYNIQPHQQRCVYNIPRPKPYTIYKHIFALHVSQNVTAHAQSTSTTHFSYSSKYRRTSLYKSYHRVFDSLNQKARVRAITSAPPIFVYVEYVLLPTTVCQ